MVEEDSSSHNQSDGIATTLQLTLLEHSDSLVTIAGQENQGGLNCGSSLAISLDPESHGVA